PAPTRPLRAGRHVIVAVAPLAVPRVAAALVAVSGLVLLLLARGVRRGQRHAWTLSLAVLGASALLHVLKGVDLEEAVSAAIVAGYLLRHGDCFTARPDVPSVRRGVGALVGGVSVATLVATVVTE